MPIARLKWSLRTPKVDCAIPSIKDMEELDEDIQAMWLPYTAPMRKPLPHSGIMSGLSTAWAAAPVAAGLPSFPS
ncbi:MAG: hypothetical protein ACE15E_08045 [Acidobacteriota bacterium]